ncbi:hypothetical protein GGS26DRAFT_542267 [Hypomontagnella submonticulosa]|nr:hypothetical protein GGS26DRAFT_542267 [Hypomontagnella submonticulosa]
MSSMLKKTGGLSFKPKVAPRRPGGAASLSQVPPAPASSSTTQAPTTEASSQAATPTPTVPPPVPSIESSSHEIGAAQKENPKEALQVETEKPSAQPRPAPAVPQVSISTATSATPSTTPSATTDEPLPRAPSAPTPAPAKRAAEPTPSPATDKRPQSSPSISISASVERPTQPTPAPEITALGTPPATQPEKPTPSTSAVPVVAISQPVVATDAPTPLPSAPVQTRVAPPTAPPSPAPVSDTIAVSTPIDETNAAAPKKKRTYRKRQPATASNVGTEGAAPKQKRPRKRPAAEATETAPAEGATEGGEAGPPAKRAYRRRRTSPSPEEDPESQTVDHTTMKMAELTKDLGIGKRFKHADAIEERAREARERFRQKRLAKKKRALGIPTDEESDSRAGTPAEGEENGRESAIARARNLGASVGAGAQQSVGYEVVDGQIIINQQSLVVDRHAAHRDMSALETVEEDEFSNLTTSSSYRRESRRTGPNHWTDEETEKFYRLLKMFGTDFESISAMFPEKTRRAVKLKFNREENLRPKRINAAVMVRGEKKVDIDIEEYKAHQTEWQESDKIMAEHAKLVEEHNEDIRRLKEERRAAGLMDEDDDEQPANGQEGQADGAAAEETIEEEVIEEDAAVPAATNGNVAVSA